MLLWSKLPKVEFMVELFFRIVLTNVEQIVIMKMVICRKIRIILG